MPFQAYSAGLSIGGHAGLIMAPVAAALAVARGAVQIALLKKQQQAAAAIGYSEGGFTRPGRVDEPAGIVHAGEWVASQKLVNSPRTRPLIEMLEYAQRNNRIGSISMEDVSHSISAPMINAYAPARQQPVIIRQTPPAPPGLCRSGTIGCNISHEQTARQSVCYGQFRYRRGWYK